MQRLPEPLRSTLRDLATALNEGAVEWRLGGSALLAILGANVEVHDLDVTVVADALDAVHAACGRWIREVHVGDATPPWCSDWLARLRIDDTEVDVIGGFCLKGPSGPVSLPQDIDGVLDLDGVDVPLADPAVWWWVYRTYQPAKAAELAQFVSTARLLAIQRRLGHG